MEMFLNLEIQIFYNDHALLIWKYVTYQLQKQLSLQNQITFLVLYEKSMMLQFSLSLVLFLL